MIKNILCGLMIWGCVSGDCEGMEIARYPEVPLLSQKGNSYIFCNGSRAYVSQNEISNYEKQISGIIDPEVAAMINRKYDALYREVMYGEIDDSVSKDLIQSTLTYLEWALIFIHDQFKLNNYCVDI